MHVIQSVHFQAAQSLMTPPLSVFPQFLCLKNIRTFLMACSEVFGMKKSELFEAFDLFDVRDFGKVRQQCSVTQNEAHWADLGKCALAPALVFVWKLKGLVKIIYEWKSSFIWILNCNEGLGICVLRAPFCKPGLIFISAKYERIFMTLFCHPVQVIAMFMSQFNRCRS